MAIHARPYKGAPDPERLSLLLAECDAILGIGLKRTPEVLQFSFENPEIDQIVNLWEDETGRLLGYSLLEFSPPPEPKATLRFRAHPATPEVDAAIMTWAIAHCAKDNGRSAVMQMMSSAHNQDIERVHLLEKEGFKPIRFFHQLVRPLDAPVEAPDLPPGFTLRHADPAQDGAAWVEMYNQTFIDHWDHYDLTLERYRHVRETRPGYFRHHDLIAIAPDSTFAAFCWSFIDLEAEFPGDARSALLHQIGTRRGFRQRGLARAMIWNALRQLQLDGVTRVRLYVDADNAMNATRLYESVGFTHHFTLTTYAREIVGAG